MNNRILKFVSLAGCVMFAGCNSKGIPVEYASLFNPANDKKIVEVVGYFKNSGNAMCSNSKNDSAMRCPINFVDTPTSTVVPIHAQIAMGKGNNQIENVDKKGLKIRDDKGEFVDNTQKVKITASIGVFIPPPTQKNAALCYMRQVKKIEKL